MSPQQVRSAGLSIGVHAVILLLLMFLYISSPIPPFEEGLAGGGGGGSFVEFGTLDVEEAPVAPPPPVVEEAKDEEIMTSDIEETVTIDQPEKKKETPKPVKKPIVPAVKQLEPVKQPELAKVEVRKPDANALYPGKRSNAGSPTGTQTGSGTGGEGTGDGGGKGSGKGPGTGSGTGSGNGSGNGDGNGFGYDLGGRKIRIRPRLEESSQETGRVVISVIVDKDGNVTNADGPARGSTTTSPVLVSKAKQAAREAKFERSANGVEEQRGTITFVFKFQ